MTTIDFSGALFDPKKYFISSDLLTDTGIECPDANIRALCLLVDMPDEIIKKIRMMTTTEIIEAYEFFDQYCISKGIILLFKSAIKTLVQNKPIIGNYNVIKYIYQNGDANFASIVFSKNINKMCVGDIWDNTNYFNGINTCTGIEITDDLISIDYTSPVFTPGNIKIKLCNNIPSVLYKDGIEHIIICHH